MYDEIIKTIDKFNHDYLSPKKCIHVDNVVLESIKLAKRFDVDIEKARLCAYAHDMYKWAVGDKLNSLITKFNLPTKYFDKPNIAHSKIACEALKRDFGINDIDVLNAVSFHTTGRANMSNLEKIIYLADAIEPNRDYYDVDKIRIIAETDLNEACLMSFKSTLTFLNGGNKEIDSDTLEAVRYFESLKENI